jgi:mutator protein MutT
MERTESAAADIVHPKEGANTGGTMAVHICVGGLMMQADGEMQILLGHRSPHRPFYPDVWDMPGGHCEVGETPEQALVRELREEIGVTPTVWWRFGDIHVADREDNEVIFHVFIVTEWVGTPSNRLPDEHGALGWFSVDDACRLPLAHPDYPAWFQRLRVSQRITEQGAAIPTAARGRITRQR